MGLSLQIQCESSRKRGQQGKYDSIKAIAFNAPPHVSKLNKEVISHLPNSLKFICGKGAGYDKVRSITLFFSHLDS